MSISFCTILNARYLAQGLALYHSWLDTAHLGRFYFYAVDDNTVPILQKLSLPNARLVRPEEFAHDSLEAQRDRRSVGEFCWASKPLVIRHMLGDMPEANWACYLDADMALFGELEPALDQAAPNVFGLVTPHRFGSSMMHWIPKTGIHNAGFAAFRQSPQSQPVLERWFRDCLARPSPEARGGETFDQKILDQIADEEPGVADLDHPGVNLAPWNADNFDISHSSNDIRVDGKKLILYHYQSLRVHRRRLVTLYNGDWRISSSLRRFVYRPYVRRLRKAVAMLRAIDPSYRLPTHAIARNWKEYLVLMSLLARQKRHLVFA